MKEPLIQKFLESFCLIQLQAAVFFSPAVVDLHRDLNFLAGLRSGLSVRDSHFDLSQQRHDLFRLVPLRFMGALLSSALIIIPAATARQLTGRMTQFVIVSCVASLVSVAAGFLISTLIFKTATVGPTIVIVAVILFVLSLFRKTLDG